VLAIVLTARVLGWQLGVARAVGAVVFSVVIGLVMHGLFLREERAKAAQAEEVYLGDEGDKDRPLWQVALFFATMIGILVFANWAKPQQSSGPWASIFAAKWWITGILLLVLAGALPFLRRGEREDWRDQTWGFAKQILPLLFGGVLLAGFLLGSPESTDGGIVPNAWIKALVGDSPRTLLSMLGKSEGESVQGLEAVWPLWTNLFAALAGALMYFATLTEVPIVRGLIDSGMGQGPALALLLAGPALSLPSLLVINSILGPKKTLVFMGLVVCMATMCGLCFGWMVKP
jgi:uncharacterized membrane protein YraQ (UPF0718 family)